MAQNIVERIISDHLVSGRMVPGEEISIRIDQALTQDATGTLAYLQLEAMGVPRVRTELSVSYVDHNLLQTDFRNADDHRYLQSAAGRYGVIFSRPGNGICHQVHLERFGVPGKTLLGSDSHTPTDGGLGALGIGAGGLDVAAAMAGMPFYLTMPHVVGVRLIGELPPCVSAKDVILEVLRRLGVKGGVGKILEYLGPGLGGLSVPQRATIANMGAETGATSSIFPSDEMTLAFLRAQGRAEDWRPLAADPAAGYDEVMEVNLSELEPLVAQPSSPANVVSVREVEGTPVAQVCVGSCTNSSAQDLMTVAAILKGKRVHSQVSLTVSPGSRRVYLLIAHNGSLVDLITAGARVLEVGCGPCIGMGQAPPTGAVSMRSFNRNFPARSGTVGDRVYLASPKVCAATALFGQITDPRRLSEVPSIAEPERYPADDSLLVFPPADGSCVELVRGPNIQPLPMRGPLEDVLRGRVLLKVGDDVTTDHIMPAGPEILPLRSNIPAISRHLFQGVDPTFARRAQGAGGGFVVAGANYGQGSSREHAALAPMYLGVKAVVARSFARIHQANLVNYGILPLCILEESDHEAAQQGDEWEIAGVREKARRGEKLTVRNLTTGRAFLTASELTERQRFILLAGGLLNYIRAQGR